MFVVARYLRDMGLVSDKVVRSQFIFHSVIVIREFVWREHVVVIEVTDSDSDCLDWIKPFR